MTIEFILILASVFFIGVWVGQKLTDRKWRENAQDYRRIESKGNLYKVMQMNKP